MIYLDNAATTQLSSDVLERMMPYFGPQYANASGVYAAARAARKAVEQARRDIAAAMGATPQEVFFTSGGTESDNWAIRGVLEAAGTGHVITTSIEHHAVLHSCRWLEEKSHRVTYVPVDGQGIVSPEDIKAAINPDTRLISVMAANNEIGTLQPIAEIGAIARAHGIPLHVDAVQAAGTMRLDVNEWKADLISISAHKFHGPKGIGALYVRNETPIKPLLLGGAQEIGRRAGTENVAGIVGMAAALTIAQETMDAAVPRIRSMRDHLLDGIISAVPGTVVNGHRTQRLAGNINVHFDGVEGEALLLRLDLAGIAASSGAACTSGVLEPSHVLMALGRTRRQARSAIRLTLSDRNTPEEIDQVLQILPDIISDLRNR